MPGLCIGFSSTKVQVLSIYAMPCSPGLYATNRFSYGGYDVNFLPGLYPNWAKSALSSFLIDGMFIFCGFCFWEKCWIMNVRGIIIMKSS